MTRSPPSKGQTKAAETAGKFPSLDLEHGWRALRRKPSLVSWRRGISFIREPGPRFSASSSLSDPQSQDRK